MKALVALGLLALLALAPPLPARLAGEELWSASGFFVDLPEGFRLKEGDGKSRFSFEDPAGGLEFDILAYDPGRFASAEAFANDSLVRIGSNGEREAFVYERRNAVFAELAFSLGGARKRGYAIFIEAARPPAAPAAQQAPARPATPDFTAPPGAAPQGATGAPAAEKHVALLAFCDEARFEAYADFILSSLDCFSADRAARRSPGPLSQYLLPWPAAREETRKIVFGGESLVLPFSTEEAEQCAGVAGREFRVLEAYGGTEDLWKAAWARCYRMIYRESARRLDRLALELDRRLPEDPTEAARRLLAWVQEWKYERDLEGIDFVDPFSAAHEARGDCDSRAMVMAIVLERRGVDAILMLSRDYSHAMAGVDVPGGGQRFAFGGKNWLVAETTAKVGIGMIAADQSDWKKWLGVSFGDE